MDAKSLMIDDWVNIDNHGIKQISLVGQDAICFIKDTKPYQVAEYIIKPIPLTEEMLKANGFDCEGQLKVLYRKPYEIAVRLDNNYSEICIAEMVYNPEDATETNWQADIELNHSLRVHELQHAFRLCGLDELADNFKLDTTNE